MYLNEISIGTTLKIDPVCIHEDEMIAFSRQFNVWLHHFLNDFEMIADVSSKLTSGMIAFDMTAFCGLTMKDIDLENRILNIDHQLQRTSEMKYVIESTKTAAGTRKILITDEVAECFRAIIEDRERPKIEHFVDGYSGFLFYDKDGMPLVALHWKHRFRHMVQRYNEIFRKSLPKITPHVCRHTYCSNQAKSGMNPKTLQYLMGHSDIGVTMNVYTHLGLDDAVDELNRLKQLEEARKEIKAV